MDNNEKLENGVLDFVLELVGSKSINENLAKSIQAIVDENRLLRKANTYNQSLLDIYNKWFGKLGVKEEDIREEEKSYTFSFNPSEPICFRESKIYDFPRICISSLVDDNLFNALTEAKSKTVKCKVCNNGKDGLMNYGEPFHVCPECGRILR